MSTSNAALVLRSESKVRAQCQSSPSDALQFRCHGGLLILLNGVETLAILHTLDFATDLYECRTQPKAISHARRVALRFLGSIIRAEHHVYHNPTRRSAK